MNKLKNPYNMLQNIIEVLRYAKGETELIRIAQGKYELPMSFRGLINKVKQDIEWHKK
tara:strand:- start:776 stop:949 length:174 start_codon:yes stop_codon:yes gene_type:complete